MRNATLSFSVLLCVCVLLPAHRLGGQTPAPAASKTAPGEQATPTTSPAVPPSAAPSSQLPPPPGRGAAPPGAAVSALLQPPPPIGIPPEELPRFEVASVKKLEGRGTTSAPLRRPRRAEAGTERHACVQQVP